METSATKRRKTSPLTALPIESTTPQDAPPDAPTAAASPRASYRAPAKASLSGHNPDTLLRRPSSSKKARIDNQDPQGLEAGTLSRPQLEAPSPRPDRQLREDHWRATSLHQGPDTGLLRSPTRQLGGGLAARPKRTPVKPNPRPLPPPGSDDDDDILNPFAGRVLRRSPLAGLPELHPPEPELPPTPDHPDHAVSTPPTGIHSTPSKRPRRSRALAEKIRTSPTRHHEAKSGSSTSGRQNDGILPTTESEPPPAFARAPQADRKAAKSRSRPKPSDIRDVEPAGVELRRRRERDALLVEIAQLEGDLGVVAQENERIRHLQLLRKEVFPTQDTSAIFDVIKRHVAPGIRNVPADRSVPWVQAALDPITFMPFGKPFSTVPTLFPEDSSEIEPEPEPSSHNPLPLTAREALPFLQTFTPLKLTSRIAILPNSTRDATAEVATRSDVAILQHHSMTATSASAPGLFSARIEMIVNTRTHAITSLAVPSINPPSAAAELSPLTAKVFAEPEASSSALSRNIGVLTWAMGSWLRIAVRRAKIWRTLDRELGTTDAVVQTVARVRAARKGRRLKRKADEGADEDAYSGGGKDADSDGVNEWIDSLVDTDDLLPYMGRLWMDFRIPSLAGEGAADIAIDPDTYVPVLRIEWQLEFDWTGEPSSQIRALVSLPGKWHHADDRTTLLGIPALFDKLIQRGEGVVPAVEGVVALLAGDQRK